MSSLNEISPKKIRGRWLIDSDTNLQNFIFNLIKNKGPITRGELSKLTNIPRTTLYDYIIGFVKKNEIEKFPVPAKKRGRPLIYYKIVE
ncbi:MAG: hypothetical protein ACTSRG_08765 [Candidatus Helarchaeota archaeon]